MYIDKWFGCISTFPSISSLTCASDVCLQCVEQCQYLGMSSGWYSNIIIDNSNSPFGINLTWTGYSADSLYIIQYRDKDSSVMYQTITNVRWNQGTPYVLTNGLLLLLHSSCLSIFIFILTCPFINRLSCLYLTFLELGQQYTCWSHWLAATVSLWSPCMFAIKDDQLWKLCSMLSNYES